MWQWAWCLVLCFVLLTLPILGCAKAPPITEPAPVEQNPVVEYASRRGLSRPIIDKLQPLGYDGMNQDEKALIDYLYGISQAEVVSPEVLEFVPSTYIGDVVRSLQTKVVDALLSDGEVSPKEADALTYLSTFPGKTQSDLIEFALDDTTIEFLILNSSLENQDFARYAVENKLCIQDHKLTDLGKSFLEKPGEHAHVLLNDYLSQLNRTYPELAEELGKLPDLKPNASNSEAVTQESQKVYLLTSSSVYESLKPWIDRWIEDVERTGTQIITKTIRKETPDEIRALLQNTPNLTGCLMVGDIPAVKYEMDFTLEGKPFHEEFPTDLYYMDLDGDWLDVDNDGILDTHKGNISPEIWAGRLKTSNLPALGNEMELLKNYFNKNHLYRIGALTLPDKALLYIDDLGAILWVDPGGNPVTYLKLAEPYDEALSPVYEERVVVTEPEITVASDYLKRLEEGWSLVRLIVHSGGFGHHFKIREKWDGKVFPQDICRKDPKALFYTIISCENFDYTRPNYMGGCYVFSKSYSLLAIGESGIHDVLQVLPEEFFPYLRSEGFGSAFLRYLQECVKNEARLDSVHNAIMIGDPLLKPTYNGQDSDGDGLTDQYELSVNLDRFDVDTDHDGVSDLEEAKFIEYLRYTKVQSIEAAEDILELASSNDAEVKEAFKLMIKSGNLYEEINMQISKGEQVAKNIKIDGRKDDWGNLRPTCIDVNGDDVEKVAGTDILGVYAVMDENHLYVMFDMDDKPREVAYVFAIDVDEDEDWDYAAGFRTNRAWFYDVRNYKNREWPEKAEILTEARIAFDEVAEFQMPLSKIGNSQTIVIYPWVSDYPKFFDQAGAGIVSRKPLMSDWNTELQLLYSLAEQNEFRPNDTLAQAVAIDNGIWVTLGNEEVRQTVYKTANELLNFFRETNEIQKAKGFHQLEDYPLEAKLSLGWVQGNSLIASHGEFYHPVYYGVNKK